MYAYVRGALHYNHHQHYHDYSLDKRKVFFAVYV
jgi:hypothetical protein